MKSTKLLPILLLLSVLFITSCSDSDKLSSEKDFVSFAIVNLGLEAMKTQVEGDKIIVTFPSKASSFSGILEFTLPENASASIESGESIDLDKTKEIIVVAEDRTIKTYTFVVKQEEGIADVRINWWSETGIGTYFVGVVDEEQKTITIVIPFDYLEPRSSFSIQFVGSLTSIPQNGEVIGGENQSLLFDKVTLFDANSTKLKEYDLILKDRSQEQREVKV